MNARVYMEESGAWPDAVGRLFVPASVTKDSRCASRGGAQQQAVTLSISCGKAKSWAG